MLLLYQLGIFIFGVLTRIASLLNVKARDFVRGRKSWRGAFHEALCKNKNKLLWMHVASLGEFEQGRPIIETVKEKYPNIFILLTFYSPSGYNIRRNYDKVDFVGYLPLDTPRNANDFLSIVRPDLVIFVKYEFWYFFLREIQKRNIPLFFISCVFRSNQLFFKSYGTFFSPLLKKITKIYVQDITSQKLISKINSSVKLAGDTRLDRVLSLAHSDEKFEVIEEFLDNSSCFILGSVWKSDIKVLSSFVKENQKISKFIIAPHNIYADEIKYLDELFENTVLYSNYSQNSKHQILIIDCIGVLSSLYRYAKYAYVGGGFRGALHNILEPLVYKIPIFFGHHFKNKKFNEAVDLAERRIAFPIDGVEDMKRIYAELDEDQGLYEEVKTKTKEYLNEKRGATNLIITELEHYINR